MRNTLLLCKYNLSTMLKQKSFWFTNLFFVILIVGVIGFVAFSGGEDEVENVTIYNESSLPITNETFDQLTDYTFDVVTEKPVDYEEELTNENWSAYVEITKDTPPRIIFYGDEDYSLQTTVQAIVSEIQKQVTITNLDISEEEKQNLLAPVEITSESIQNNNNDEADVFSFETFIVFYALIMLFYFLTIQYPTSVMNMLVSAKESRAVESLLVRVTPTQFFYGKIGTIVVIATAQLLFFLALLVVPIILKDAQPMFEIFADAVAAELTFNVLAIYLGCYVLMLLFYCVFNGLLASFVNRIEEVANVSYFAIIGTMAGFFVSIQMFTNGEPSTLGYVLAIVPFTSPYLIFTLYMLGALTAPIFIGSIAVMVVSLGFLFMFAGSIYKKYLFKSDAKIKDLFSINNFKKKKIDQNL